MASRAGRDDAMETPREKSVDDHIPCGGCGYDLFGQPGSGCCPECNAPIWTSVRDWHNRDPDAVLATRYMVRYASLALASTIGFGLALAMEAHLIAPFCLVISLFAYLLALACSLPFRAIVSPAERLTQLGILASRVAWLLNAIAILLCIGCGGLAIYIVWQATLA